jgi:hypothetical protein
MDGVRPIRPNEEYKAGTRTKHELKQSLNFKTIYQLQQLRHVPSSIHKQAKQIKQMSIAKTTTEQEGARTRIPRRAQRSNDMAS